MAAEKKLPEPRTIDVVGMYQSHLSRISNFLKQMFTENEILMFRGPAKQRCSRKGIQKGGQAGDGCSGCT